MKTEETIQERDARVQAVRINPELTRREGEILFPEKLARAEKMLKNAKLPPNQNLGRKKPE